MIPRIPAICGYSRSRLLNPRESSMNRIRCQDFRLFDMMQDSLHLIHRCCSVFEVWIPTFTIQQDCLYAQTLRWFNIIVQIVPNHNYFGWLTSSEYHCVSKKLEIRLYSMTLKGSDDVAKYLTYPKLAFQPRVSLLKCVSEQYKFVALLQTGQTAQGVGVSNLRRNGVNQYALELFDYCCFVRHLQILKQRFDGDFQVIVRFHHKALFKKLNKRSISELVAKFTSKLFKRMWRLAICKQRSPAVKDYSFDHITRITDEGGKGFQTKTTASKLEHFCICYGPWQKCMSH